MQKFRSSERDLRTDAKRLGALNKELGRALGSVERELGGLRSRLEEARSRTGLLMGNEDGIYFEREPETERLLALAEGQMMYAQQRVSDLESQKLVLARVLGDLRGEIGSTDVRGFAVGQDGSGASLARYALAWMRPLGAAFGWILLCAIVYATLSPLALRPQLSWLPVDIERFMAVFITTTAFVTGYPHSRRRVLFTGILLVCLLEAAQVLLETRHGAVSDMLVKAAAVGGAFVLAPKVEQWCRGWLSRR